MLKQSITQSYLRRVLAAVMLGLSALLSVSSFSINYAPRSVMEKGKWVKIGVEDSGVYEISYSTLREMGFTNPANIGVYGRGGSMLPLQFTDEEGKMLYDDDLTAVPVYHYDNRLFFYASGVENISFNPNSQETTGGHFINKGLNIYSNKGYYFLTESDNPCLIQNQPAINASAGVDSGVGYVYYEKDLQQNHSNTGQLFWGEKFNGTGSKYQTWNVIFPDLLKDRKGVMNCAFVSNRGVSGATLSYGIVGAEDKVELATSDKPTIYYHYQSPEYGDISFTTDKGRVFVNYECGDNASGIANLDYWIVTYPKSVPTLQLTDGTKLAQDRITFSSLKPGESAKVPLKNCMTFEVWNITNPSNPVRIEISRTGKDGSLTLKRDVDVPGIVVFDTSRSQKQISGYEKGYESIGNQNLHAFAAEGAELAIITLPELKESAEKLADLHRKYDGIKVVVATAEEVYNEFSGGMPDPMAYRSFAKMLYDSPGRKLKNLLLIGPLYGDFRGLNIPKDPQKGLIAYQAHRVNYEKGCMNANDVYGMMESIPEEELLEKQPMQIGVGILPCYFESELLNYIDKVERYLTDESFAYRINSNLAIGGVANNHIHDNQAIEAGDLLDRHNFNASINSKLIINAYGNDGARAKLFESFNQGKNFVIYYGHGAPTYIGLDKLFFTGAHISQFRNKALPFMAFAGCLLSNTDRGQRGIGESIVLDTRFGTIGALLATRDTWSGQNKELMTQFINAMYRTNPNNITSMRHPEALTIGEVFAATKTVGTFENEMAYQLICDPAIVIPVANRKINASMSGIRVIPGQSVTVTGTVLQSDERTVDETFNGEIVVRLLEPAVSLVSEDLVVEEDSELIVEYSDIQASMSVGEVIDGHFSVTIAIPPALRRWEKERISFNFAAYDSSKRVGAAALKSAIVLAVPSTSKPSVDLTPPVIEEIYFDAEECDLVVSAYDETALNTTQSPTAVKRGFQLYLDGDFVGRASDVTPIISDGQTRQTRVIPLHGIQYGKHHARVEVTDLGGNSAERDLYFEYAPYVGKFFLTMSDSAVVDEVDFEVKGHLPDEATLYIVNEAGEEIFSAPMEDGSFRWTRINNVGARVESGLYKAYIRENREGVKGHSNSIRVPVI